MTQPYQAQIDRIYVVTTYTLKLYSPPVLRHRLNAVGFSMRPSPEGLRNTEIWMLRMCIRTRTVFWLLSFNISTLFTVNHTCFFLCVLEVIYKFSNLQKQFRFPSRHMAKRKCWWDTIKWDGARTPVSGGWKIIWHASRFSLFITKIVMQPATSLTRNCTLLTQ